MRAVFFALVLCLCAPQVPLGAIDAPTPDPAGSVAFGAAAPASSHLIRAAAKADKSFGGGSLIPPPRVTLHAIDREFGHRASYAAEPPNLALNAPPLAPRPPPLG